MLNNQNQKAGDNSQQLQADNMVFNIGIDEKRAREIYQEMNMQLRNDYSKEALIIANKRVAEFEDRLLPKMEAVDGALEAFADPSFQLLLVEAQKTAASTERTADYDLLAELLVHRFKKGSNRNIRAGINRAVEIVDEISDDALLGLTVFHSVSNFFPLSGDIQLGLDVLDQLFSKIIYSELPKGNDWLDHLDILDAIRVNSFGTLKKIEQYYPEMLPGYVDVGIEKGSDDHNKAIKTLEAASLPQNILVEHYFNSEFVRIDLTGRGQIDSISLERKFKIGTQTLTVPLEVTLEQKNAITSIYDFYKNDDTIKQENIRKFLDEWQKREHLKILKEWWDSISNTMQLTSVGKVLAHSNAQRCDKNLPALE